MQRSLALPGTIGVAATALLLGAAAAVVVSRWVGRRQSHSPTPHATLPGRRRADGAGKGGTVEAAPAPVRCVVVLHEVTKDRFIHFLMRPATALGAAEVIWVGAHKARGELRGVGSYGRAMREEAPVPLTNLSSMFQVRRHLTTEAVQDGLGGTVAVVGVAWCSAGVPLAALPRACLLSAFDFRRYAPGTVALYLAGESATLTEAQCGECDAVVFVVQSRSIDGDTAAPQPALTGSALLAVVLHQLCVSLGRSGQVPAALAEAAASPSSSKFDAITRVELARSDAGRAAAAQKRRARAEARSLDVVLRDGLGDDVVGAGKTNTPASRVADDASFPM